MKRFLLSTLVISMSLGTLVTSAKAGQVEPGHSAADTNGDGQVSLTEVRNYNRDQRDA
jgi:hypothetical protein